MLRKLLMFIVCFTLAASQVWAQGKTGKGNPPGPRGKQGVGNQFGIGPGRAVEKRQEAIDRFQERHPDAGHIEKRKERLEEFKAKHQEKMEDRREHREEWREDRREGWEEKRHAFGCGLHR